MNSEIVCDNNCENCDFEHWMWIKKNHVMILGNRYGLNECPKIHDDE